MGKQRERRPQAPKRGPSRLTKLPESYGPAIARAGRDRKEDEGRREKTWLKRYREAEEQTEDAAGVEKRSEAERWVESVEDIEVFGADLPGVKLHGLVVEVQRGQCLVEIVHGDREPDAGAPPFGAAEAPGGRTAAEDAAEWAPSGEGRAARLVPAGAGERRVVRCVVRGLLKHFDLGYRSLLAVGDRVDLAIPEVRGSALGEAEGFIVRILPRTHSIERVAPGWRSVQLLATNVDLLAVVTSVAEPPFRAGFVDRALLLAECADIPPLIVLNKADLGVSEEIQGDLDDFAAAGYRVLKTSAVTREGLDALRAELSGRVTALNGHSGVGKSSLLAALDANLDLFVQEVSETTGRGRHTTTSSTMHRVSGIGWVIDTPGIRELSPAGLRKGNLWQFFPEMRGRAGLCEFSDCTHTGEKGCAIEQAAANGEFSERRLEGYRRILKTLPEG